MIFTFGLVLIAIGFTPTTRRTGWHALSLVIGVFMAAGSFVIYGAEHFP